MTRTVWRFRLAATCAGADGGGVPPVAGSRRRRHQARPDAGPGWLPEPRAAPVGRPGASSASCRTRPTATCGRWGRSSGVGRRRGVAPWVDPAALVVAAALPAFLGASVRPDGASPRRRLGIGPLVSPGSASCCRRGWSATLGPISAESLPYGAGTVGADPAGASATRRAVRHAAAAALSGRGVLLMGGRSTPWPPWRPLPVGGLWILLPRRCGRRTWSLVGWWALAAGWPRPGSSVPLLLLGRYSPPFLDWIESAAVTTSITDGSARCAASPTGSPTSAAAAGPQWPAGWQLVSERALVVGDRRAWRSLGVVGPASCAAPGTGGSSSCSRARRARRARGWRTCPPAGSGPTACAAPAPRRCSTAPSPRCATSTSSTSGSGCRWPSASAGRRRARRRPARVGRAAPRCVAPTLRDGGRDSRPSAVVAPRVLVVAAVGALRGDRAGAARRPHRRADVRRPSPGYWLEAAGWLAGSRGPGPGPRGPGRVVRRLPVGRAAATSRCSRTPRRPGRSATPCRCRRRATSGRSTRWRRCSSTVAATPALAAYLARMGVSYLVVRNDLDLRACRLRPALLVHQALAQSGGFVARGRVRADPGGLELRRGARRRRGDRRHLPGRGGLPVVGHGSTTRRVVLRDASTPSVLARRVRGPARPSAPPTARLGTVAPRPVDVPPALAAASAAGRRRHRSRHAAWEVDFGRVHDNRSSTLDAGCAVDAATARCTTTSSTPAAPGPEVVYPGFVVGRPTSSSAATRRASDRPRGGSLERRRRRRRRRRGSRAARSRSVRGGSSRAVEPVRRGYRAAGSRRRPGGRPRHVRLTSPRTGDVQPRRRAARRRGRPCHRRSGQPDACV